MSRSMNLLFFSALLVVCIVQFVNCLDCESCGKECKQICGTKRFRNCCYNYIKKRSDPDLHLGLIMDRPETPEYYPSLKNILVGQEDGYRSIMYPDESSREK